MGEIVNAHMEMEVVGGEREMHLIRGDIAPGGFSADINAQTVSGDVDVDGDGKEGEWDLSSVSGDVTAVDISGDVDAEVVSGDIEIMGGAFDRVRMETVNGDIVFVANLKKGGKLDAESVNGGVEIQFVGSVSARFDIETFNGRIRNCFGPKAKRADQYAPGWELSFSEGGGDGRVSIETLNGGVEICRK